MAAPSVAQDLSGEWQFKRKAREGYHTGTLVIDKDGQVSAEGPQPAAGLCPMRSCRRGGGKVEIVFTSVKSSRRLQHRSLLLHRAE